MGESVGADERRAGEGGQDDVFVAKTVFGAFFGAPLAHAGAVAPAVAFDEANLVAVADHLDEGAQEGGGGVLAGAEVDRPAELLAGEAVLVAARVGDEEADGAAPAVLGLHV